jgi:hypothetical protein
VVGPLGAQEPVRLSEKFDTAEATRVEVRVTLSGRVTVPGEKGKPAQTLPINGSSTLIYDERPLPADDPKTSRVARLYRDVRFTRTVGPQEQTADIRPSVRRMVVMRSDRGKKAPFSPDGPLTWGEIDVVRTDLFAPALVPGLLPAGPVKPGAAWPMTPAAVAELTDIVPIDDGRLNVEYVSDIELDGRRYAKFTISGAVRGVGEDGPTRQKLDGIGYFDLDSGRLSYLNLTGSRELLGPDGLAAGKIDGKFVLTRKAAGRVPELSDNALRAADLSPTPDNTLLLYDNPDLGVRFLHPRRWKVGGVRGRQVTLDEPRGGGVLITLDPPESVPTAAQFLAESREHLSKRSWTVLAADPPTRWAEKPARVDRFGLDAEGDGQKVRMEYAVVSQPEGGATVAARLPWADRDELKADIDRVLKGLVVTKRVV